MKFYTQYDRPSLDECPLEIHLDEGLVETAGYRTTEELVMQLIQAGENLQAFRMAEYDSEEEIPEDAPANRMMSSLDATLAYRQHMKALKQKVEDGNTGRDSGRSTGGDGLGNKSDELASAEGSKPAERGADETKLAT